MTKLSLGKAEDLATTILLASNKDIILVPAMNVRMWSHKATQNNCKTLIGYGYNFLGPKSGSMACGEYGPGKMLSPKKIFDDIKKYFHKRNFVNNILFFPTSVLKCDNFNKSDREIGLDILVKYYNYHNHEIKNLNHEISLVVINDASSQQIIDTYPNTLNINSIEIVNMKENRGHSRCIASGLKYIFKKKEFNFVIPMDGDGEDRPEEILEFIKNVQATNDRVIVGERIKRSENLLFKICYQIHKLITFTFTGKSIRFGNYTCLPKKTVEKMIQEKATWNSFSGSLKKIENDLIPISSMLASAYAPSPIKF